MKLYVELNLKDVIPVQEILEVESKIISFVNEMDKFVLVDNSRYWIRADPVWDREISAGIK